MVFERTSCRHCGAYFRYPREFGVVRYCSAVCRVAQEPPVEPWEYKGCRGKHYFSESRRQAYSAGDSIDYLVVYRAYDWTCWFCSDRIDPMLQAPHPRSATIDHIVKLERGGMHVWDNIVPMHLECNNIKDTNEESFNSVRPTDSIS